MSRATARDACGRGPWWSDWWSATAEHRPLASATLAVAIIVTPVAEARELVTQAFFPIGGYVREIVFSTPQTDHRVVPMYSAAESTSHGQFADNRDLGKFLERGTWFRVLP